MEYYSSMRKKETLPFAILWMDLESSTLNEINYTEKNENSVISLIMWNLKILNSHKQRK